MQSIHPSLRNNKSLTPWGEVSEYVDIALTFSNVLIEQTPLQALDEALVKTIELNDSVRRQDGVEFLDSFLDLIAFAMETLQKRNPSEMGPIKIMIEELRPLASDQWYERVQKQL